MCVNRPLVNASLVPKHGTKWMCRVGQRISNSGDGGVVSKMERVIHGMMTHKSWH